MLTDSPIKGQNMEKEQTHIGQILAELWVINEIYGHMVYWKIEIMVSF